LSKPSHLAKFTPYPPPPENGADYFCAASAVQGPHGNREDVLKGYCPQAWALVGEPRSSPLALDFLRRWPTLTNLKASRPTALKRFYPQHKVRRPEAMAQRLDLIRPARASTTDQAIVFVSRRHVERYDREIAETFASHPEPERFRELPAAGKVLAPRLLVALGTERSRFANAAELQCDSGIAPVKEKSGERIWIHWRWSAPWFVRQTRIEWAAQRILYCAWARAYYDRQKNKGKRHWAIVRALAFKWLCILWKGWLTRKPYDEALSLKALSRRHSPLLATAQTQKS
jgi:hypothetical protein